MAYERVNWENLPSTKTPVNATNMNKIENALENLDTNMNKILSESEIYVGKEEPFAGEKVWVRKGKNLFDKSKALLGYWIENEQGDAGKGTDEFFLTDFIPVFKNVPVYIPATGSARREFYNKNKVGTTYLNNQNAQVFTPTEDGFIRVTCRISTVTMDSLMINYGTTKTEYEAYIEPQIFVKNSNGVYEKFTTNNVISGQVTATTDSLGRILVPIPLGATGANVISVNGDYFTFLRPVQSDKKNSLCYLKDPNNMQAIVNTSVTVVWSYIK